MYAGRSDDILPNTVHKLHGSPDSPVQTHRWWCPRPPHIIPVRQNKNSLKQTQISKRNKAGAPPAARRGLASSWTLGSGTSPPSHSPEGPGGPDAWPRARRMIKLGSCPRAVPGSHQNELNISGWEPAGHRHAPQQQLRQFLQIGRSAASVLYSCRPGF